VSSQFKTPKFKELQEKWYKKLEKSGFKDIEQDEYYFADGHGVSTIDKRRVTWEIQQEYYRLATHFLNDHKFKNRFEQIVWEYHSNGMSVRDIADTLNKVRRKKTDYNTVWEIIRDLRILMKTMYGVTK
jgi:hypothetical protein